MIRNFLRLHAGLPAQMPRRRSDLLERLLARAERIPDPSDWRKLAFGALSHEAAPAVAPVSHFAASARAAGAVREEFPWVWLATPVHLEPGLDNVRLPAEGLVGLSADEALGLAADFKRLWADAPVVLDAVGTRLYMLSRDRGFASTQDPELAAGEHIEEFLPDGAGAPRLKALMSEIEMWLFEHPLNRERNRLGRSTVSGLWLWGGGERVGRLPSTDFRAAGEDVLFEAFGEQGKETRVVIASHAPGSASWEAFEAAWLRAGVADLERDDGLAISHRRRLYQVTGRRHWRLFRKRTPWWEYFE